MKPKTREKLTTRFQESLFFLCKATRPEELPTKLRSRLKQVEKSYASTSELSRIEEENAHMIVAWILENLFHETPEWALAPPQ